MIASIMSISSGNSWPKIASQKQPHPSQPFTHCQSYPHCLPFQLQHQHLIHQLHICQLQHHPHLPASTAIECTLLAQKCRKCSKVLQIYIICSSTESIAPQWPVFFMPTKIYSYLGKLRLLFYLRDQKLDKIIGRVDFLENQYLISRRWSSSPMVSRPIYPSSASK